MQRYWKLYSNNRGDIEMHHERYWNTRIGTIVKIDQERF